MSHAIHNVTARLTSEQKADLDELTDNINGGAAGTYLTKPSQAQVIRFALAYTHAKFKAGEITPNDLRLLSK